MAALVIARFAGTQIAATHVRAAAAFCIGTARGVDLPVLGFTRFPIVDERGAIHIPAGIASTRAGDAVAFALGALELVIAPAAPAAPLARCVASTRAAGACLVAAAIAHVALCTAAWAAADPPPPRRGADPRAAAGARRGAADHAAAAAAAARAQAAARAEIRVRAARAAAAVRERAAAGAAELAAPAPTTAHAAARESARAHAPASANLGTAVATLWGPDLATAMQNLDPLYAGEDPAEQFGGTGRRFDVTQREGWGTIDASYETVDPGVLALHICDGAHCTASGRDESPRRDDVDPAVRRRSAGVLHAGRERRRRHRRRPRSVVLAFTIDGQGVVQGARAPGRVGDVRRGGRRRRSSSRASTPRRRVTYPISFRRAGHAG